MYLSIIPDLSREFEYITSRSSGPGGQNTNKTETKVTLRFDIATSVLLTEEQKQVVMQNLAGTLAGGSILACTSQKHRSQLQNKEHCKDKCHQIIAAALKPRIKRKKTTIPASVNEARMKEKKIKATTKQFRRKVGRNDEI